MNVEVYFKEDSLMYKHLLAKGEYCLSKGDVSIDSGDGFLKITDLTTTHVHFYNLDTIAHIHLS